MALTARLARPPARGKGHTCSIGILLSTWPLEHKAEDRRALLAALVDPAWPGTAIAGALRDEGYTTISNKHVQQHRRGDCTTENCPDPHRGLLPA